LGKSGSPRISLMIRKGNNIAIPWEIPKIIRNDLVIFISRFEKFPRVSG